jgi:hypothetical protein
VRRRVVADEDRREADRLAPGADVVGNLPADLLPERSSVDPDGSHLPNPTRGDEPDESV